MTATRKRDLRELLVLLRLLTFNIMPEIGMKDHLYLTLSRMGFSGAPHGWWGGGQKVPPGLESAAHILQ